MKTLFGRKVAIDASMSIYQFLIAVRQKDGELLTNDAGETTRCVVNSGVLHATLNEDVQSPHGLLLSYYPHGGERN